MERDLPTGLLMFISSRYAMHRIFAAVRAAGLEGVSDAQLRLMMNIDVEGTRLSVLAERADIAKQTATTLVDKLETAGFVERVPDPSDGRARLVRPTEKGAPFVPAAHAEEHRIEAEWEAHLGPKRMAALRHALTTLREVTDPYAGVRHPDSEGVGGVVQG